MTNRQARALRLAERISDILCASEEDAKAIAAAADELVRPYSENEAFQAGYAAARLEIESLQARIKTMVEKHSDELMVAHLDGRMRAAQPAGAQAAPELTETAVTARNPAAPASSFDDSRTQAVYEVLVNDNYPPAGSNEHWEGWKARLIVDALFPIEAPAAVAGQDVMAWMTQDGDRVVTARTMDAASRDGGAMLSSLRGYSVALMRANVDAAAPTTQADSVLEDAARVERERICAAIKAEDDYCVDHGDYMLDSDDCIKIVRGEWVRPDFAIDAAHKEGANHD